MNTVTVVEIRTVAEVRPGVPKKRWTVRADRAQAWRAAQEAAGHAVVVGAPHEEPESRVFPTSPRTLLEVS